MRDVRCSPGVGAVDEGEWRKRVHANQSVSHTGKSLSGSTGYNPGAEVTHHRLCSF